VPLGVRVPMLFQYSAGAHFVAEAWRRGGWHAVDRLYLDPPRSTQQIMQPELYFDHPSFPERIQLSGYQGELAGWRKVDDDTYGELLLELILQQHLAPHAPAFRSLPQWAGDRIITLQKNGKLTLLWLIAFHDAQAAGRFADAYRGILAGLGPESKPFGVTTRGSVVFVAIGEGAEDFAPLAAAVWKASSISPAPPLPPAPVAPVARAGAQARATVPVPESYSRYAGFERVLSQASQSSRSQCCAIRDPD
jgi:hypothetical protein